jgi:hypothetical protein
LGGEDLSWRTALEGGAFNSKNKNNGKNNGKGKGEPKKNPHPHKPRVRHPVGEEKDNEEFVDCAEQDLVEFGGDCGVGGGLVGVPAGKIVC